MAPLGVGPSGRDVGAGFSAVLLEEADRLHRHAAIDRLAHVVDREKPDLHRGERLHLDAGARGAFHARAALDRGSRLVQREFHAHRGERDRMAERNELGAALPALGQPLPDLGDVSSASLSEQQERTIGNRIMREVRIDPVYVDDPQVADYVASLGARLLAAADGPRRDIDYFAIQDDTI